MYDDEIEFSRFLQDAKQAFSDDNVDQSPEDVERIINENKSLTQQKIEQRRQRELIEQQQYIEQREKMALEREQFERERELFEQKKEQFNKQQEQLIDPDHVIRHTMELKQLHADLQDHGMSADELSTMSFESLDMNDREQILQMIKELVSQVKSQSEHMTVSQAHQIIDDSRKQAAQHETQVYREYLKLTAPDTYINSNNQPIDTDEQVDEQPGSRAQSITDFKRGKFDTDAYKLRAQKHEDELQELYLAEDQQQADVLNENDAFNPQNGFFKDLQAAREAELDTGTGADEDTSSDGGTDSVKEDDTQSQFPEPGDAGVDIPDISPPDIADWPDQPVPMPTPDGCVPPMFPPPVSTPTPTCGSALATFKDTDGDGTGTQSISGFYDPPGHEVTVHPVSDPDNKRTVTVDVDGKWSIDSWTNIPVPTNFVVETVDPETQTSFDPVIVTPTGNEPVSPTGDVLTLPTQPVFDELETRIGHAANWIRINDYHKPSEDYPDVNGYYAPIETISTYGLANRMSKTPFGSGYIPRYIQVYDVNGDLVLDPDNLQEAIVLSHYLEGFTRERKYDKKNRSFWCIIKGHLSPDYLHGFSRYPSLSSELLYKWPSEQKPLIITCITPTPTPLPDDESYKLIKEHWEQFIPDDGSFDFDTSITIHLKRVCLPVEDPYDPYTGQFTPSDKNCVYQMSPIPWTNNDPKTLAFQSLPGNPDLFIHTFEGPDGEVEYRFLKKSTGGVLAPVSDAEALEADYTPIFEDAFGDIATIHRREFATSRSPIYGGDNIRTPHKGASSWAHAGQLPTETTEAYLNPQWRPIRSYYNTTGPGLTVGYGGARGGPVQKFVSEAGVTTVYTYTGSAKRIGLQLNDEPMLVTISPESSVYVNENIVEKTYPRHLGASVIKQQKRKTLSQQTRTRRNSSMSQHFLVEIGMPRRVMEGRKVADWTADPHMFMSDTKLFDDKSSNVNSFGTPEYRRSDYYGYHRVLTDSQGDQLPSAEIRDRCIQMKDTWIIDGVDRMALDLKRETFWWKKTGEPLKSTRDRVQEFIETLDSGDKYIEHETGLNKVVCFYPDNRLTTPYRYENFVNDLPAETDEWWSHPNRDFILYYVEDITSGLLEPVITFATYKLQLPGNAYVDDVTDDYTAPVAPAGYDATDIVENNKLFWKVENNTISYIIDYMYEETFVNNPLTEWSTWITIDTTQSVEWVEPGLIVYKTDGTRTLISNIYSGLIQVLRQTFPE